MSQQLYRDYPDNVRFKHGLAIYNEKLGSTHTLMDNLDSALIFYKQSNNLKKQLYQDYPNNVEFKNGLVLSYQWLGWFYEKNLLDIFKALKMYQTSEILLKELVKDFPDYSEFRRNLNWVNNRISLLNR